MKHLEVFLTALRLGLTSFGGPIAHLSYFRDEYVNKKKWLSEHSYADLVALCQFLPGPASSQVGMAIGYNRSGIIGAVLSWLGFTLPSAIVLILFGLSLTHFDIAKFQHLLHGLKVVAVAVVAHAVYGMGKNLCPDMTRKILALLSALAVLFVNSILMQVLVLVGAGLFGAFFLKNIKKLPHEPVHINNKILGTSFLILFFVLLFLLPILSEIYPLQQIILFDSFYRAGSLVFGGGHVVLPLLQAEVETHGLVSNDLFMAGYGVSNAIPGPLFTFSSYLGAVASGWTGGIISLISIFLPSFFLVIGILPFWEKLRSFTKVRQSMLGLNASVVGILLAALYNPVWTSAIFNIKDFILALVAFTFLQFLKLPSWLVVIFSVLVSGFIYS